MELDCVVYFFYRKPGFIDGSGSVAGTYNGGKWLRKYAFIPLGDSYK